jgi:hypothetical protein
MSACLGVCLSFHEPFALEFGDDAAHSLTTDDGLLPEFGHPEFALRGCVDDEKDVIPGDRQPRACQGSFEFRNH